MSEEKQWLPLESNPDLMTKYLHTLGATRAFAFHDVYGTDESLLSIIPQPVLAVLLLFPITPASEAYASQHRGTSGGDDVYYMKQTVGNACGTIALLHAVLNNTTALELDTSKFAAKFLAETANLTADQRAAHLESADDIESSHHALATEATSDVAHSINDNLHFIALVQRRGRLYELDGRKDGPVDHGATSADTLLYDSMTVVKDFMAREPNDVRFSIVALAPNTE